MASILFNRKPRPVPNISTESETPTISFSKKSIQSKDNIKRAINDVVSLLDSDDEEVTQPDKRTKTGEIGDAQDGYVADIRKRVSALQSSSSGKTVQPMTTEGISLDTSSVGVLDGSFDRTALELKRKILLTKEGRSRSVNSSSSSSQATQPMVVDLEDEHVFVAPTVAPATTRIVNGGSTGSTDDMSIDRLQRLAGAPAVPVRASTLPLPTVKENSACRLRTRLNGQHTRDWKLGFDEPFSKLKANIAAVYGVQLKAMKFEFDGEGLGDKDTPRGQDMDHDCLIEIKVDKSLYDAAVKAANSCAPPSSSGATGANTANGASAAPLVKIKTRLNGKHERKWKINALEPFSTVRQNLMKLYGIADAKQLVLEFDGDRVGDAQSPRDLGIEDDDLIEVKIDPKLYEKAIASTAAK